MHKPMVINCGFWTAVCKGQGIDLSRAASKTGQTIFAYPCLLHCDTIPHDDTLVSLTVPSSDKLSEVKVRESEQCVVPARGP